MRFCNRPGKVGVLLAWSSLMAGCASPLRVDAPQELATAAALTTPPPLQWLGTWRGSLLGHHDGQVRELAPMELRVAVGEVSKSVGWRLTYGSGPAADVRDYRLVELDAKTGHYGIDEGGGVVLPARLCGDALVSVFAVSGSTLVVRYVWRGDHIDFELESVAASSASTTGKDIQVWERPSVQRARLWRQP